MLDFFAAIPKGRLKPFLELLDTEADEELRIINGVRKGTIKPAKAAKMLVFWHCLQKYPNSKKVRLKSDKRAFDTWASYLFWNNLSLGTMTELFPERGRVRELVEKTDPEVLLIDIPLIPSSHDQDLMLRSSLLLFGSEPDWMLERIRKLQGKPSTCSNDDRIRGVMMAPDLIADLHRLRFGAQAIDFSPVIGGRSPRDRFYRPHVRDVYIPCSHLPVPDDVHGNPTSYLGMYTHDAYGHLGVSSSIPRWVRESAVAMARRPEMTNGDIDFLLDMVFKPFTGPAKWESDEAEWAKELADYFRKASTG